jgi:L-ascorbate metabolism protein UlaG (beta-lactamase superfamily)
MTSSLRRTTERRLERIRASRQFADGTFHNTANVGPGLKRGQAISTMGQFFFGGQRRTPLAPLPSESPVAAWGRVPETGLRATWLGHSTVLVEMDGLRILTDPVWGERASPVGFAGPRRFQPVPVSIAALPPLDAIVISHDHYDHLDQGSIVELARTTAPFFTSLGVGARLEAWGVAPERITELDWWETAELGRAGLSITAAPSQHFSGRGLGDRNRTLWSSFVVRGPRHAFFFSGDTGLTPEYTEIAQRLGPFDLVMLEVGAFHPAWGQIHLGPVNALEALTLLGGGAFLPVHWGTFNLAIHSWDEPAETLYELASKRDVHLIMPRLGSAVEPARVLGVDPWWRAISALESRGREALEDRRGDEGPPVELGDPID